MPIADTDIANMREAIAEASLAASEGKMPFGAVLGDAAGKILFRAHNECQQAGKRGGGMGDVTRHAEMELVKLFTSRMTAEERASCTLYTVSFIPTIYFTDLRVNFFPFDYSHCFDAHCFARLLDTRH